MANLEEATRFAHSIGTEVSALVRQKLFNDLVVGTDKYNLEDLATFQEVVLYFGDAHFKEFEPLALEYLHRPGNEAFVILLEDLNQPDNDKEIVETIQLMHENPRTDDIAVALFAQLLYEYRLSALIMFMESHRDHTERIRSRN